MGYRMHGAFWLLAVLSGAAGLASGATYYIDSNRGQDASLGTSPENAWRTLEKVNATAFHSGDHVLFRAGSIWKGQLLLKVSGSDGPPLVVDRYGAGPRPKIDGEGRVEDVIRLYNIQNVEIRDLEITDHGPRRAVRRGVHIFLDNFGTARHIVIAGLYIHDVNGINGKGDPAVPTMAERRANGSELTVVLFQANGAPNPIIIASVNVIPAKALLFFSVSTSNCSTRSVKPIVCSTSICEKALHPSGVIHFISRTECTGKRME